MANNIDWNDWETDNLTPLVFDKLDTILPELDFKFQKGNWYSSLKLDGTAPKVRRHDKTVVKKELPGILIEAGESPRNIIKHYAETRSLQRYEARKELADKLGVELPQGDYTEQQPSERKRRGIMADAYAYFEYCLHSESQGAKDVLNYLTQKRGYSLELIKAMGLGYIPSQKQLTDHLAKKYSAEEIKDAIKFNAKIGDTHKLAITRTSAGRVIGFNFRTIGDHKPKYIKPAGAELPIFINLPARIDNGDLIIVEGEIDSLHATALGIKNVVCVGRNDVSDEQLIDAQRRGFTSVTVCFDNEPPNRKTNSAKALKIGNQAQALGFDVFVIELDELNPEKTDLDNYLTAMGKDAFTNLIATAHSLPIFKASVIASDYLDKLPLTEKDEHSLRKEIITAGLTVAPGLLPSYIKTVTEALELELDQNAITETIEELQSEAKLHQANKDFAKLLNDTAKSEGTITDKAQKLKKGLGEIEAKSTDLTKYLKPNNWDEFITRLKATPQGLHTGYIQGKSITDPETSDELNELLIPNKAITIIAGRSGHGKTTAMINLTLKLLGHKENKNIKRAYFFTYEMPEEQLMQRALLSYVGHGVQSMFSYTPKDAIRELITKGSDRKIKQQWKQPVKDYIDKFKNELADTGRLTFRDARGQTIEELRASITALHKRGEIDVVVIDYIQKLTTNAKKGDSKSVMKQVCEELNGLANETHLPIIVGSQFNRSIEYLYEVTETAISEADDITHLGALILGLFNNDVKQRYPNSNSATEEDKAKQTQFGHPNTFYVEVLKNRFGTPGIGFNMAYNGALQTLTNYLDGGGIIEIDEETEATQPKKLTPFQLLPKAEKPLTINAQINRAKEWAKDHATEGIDIEKGLQLFMENNPNISIGEAHITAYNSVYKTTAQTQQRKAQLIEEAKQKQAKKTK